MNKKYSYYKLRRNATIVDIYEQGYSNPVASLDIDFLIQKLGYKKV